MLSIWYISVLDSGNQSQTLHGWSMCSSFFIFWIWTLILPRIYLPLIPSNKHRSFVADMIMSRTSSFSTEHTVKIESSYGRFIYTHLPILLANVFFSIFLCSLLTWIPLNLEINLHAIIDDEKRRRRRKNEGNEFQNMISSSIASASSSLCFCRSLSRMENTLCRWRDMWLTTMGWPS